MTVADFSSLAVILPTVHRKPLGELSANDQGARCLDASLGCSALDAVSFDRVKEDWYNARFFHQVRSADALYKHGERYYLIEFKTGKPENMDLHRKLYDSVIGLMENGVLALADCRTKLQYVIVSLHYKPCDCHAEMLDHFEAADTEPWDYEVTKAALDSWDNNDIKKLTGFLVEKIYKLCPSDFERFAANRNWSN